VSKRDKVQGARNAGTEIVLSVQRGFEYRATKQFACDANEYCVSLVYFWVSDVYY
jgi:hypothetical protein